MKKYKSIIISLLLILILTITTGCTTPQTIEEKEIQNNIEQQEEETQIQEYQLSQIEKEVIDSINAKRELYGHEPLETNTKLSQILKTYSDEWAKTNNEDMAKVKAQPLTTRAELAEIKGYIVEYTEKITAEENIVQEILNHQTIRKTYEPKYIGIGISISSKDQNHYLVLDLYEEEVKQI